MLSVGSAGPGRSKRRAEIDRLAGARLPVRAVVRSSMQRAAACGDDVRPRAGCGWRGGDVSCEHWSLERGRESSDDDDR